MTYNFTPGKKYELNDVKTRNLVFLSSNNSLSGKAEDKKYFFAERQPLVRHPGILEMPQWTFRFDGRQITVPNDFDEAIGFSFNYKELGLTETQVESRLVEAGL